MISRKLPICTVPDGVIPEAQVYNAFSPFFYFIFAAVSSAQ
jgi:hypothetical protein